MQLSCERGLTFCGFWRFGGVFCLQVDIYNIKENQQCCISALAQFVDGEDRKFTACVSLSILSTALVELTSSDVAQPYKMLQSVNMLCISSTYGGFTCSLAPLLFFPTYS